MVGQVVLYYARCRFFPPVFHMYIPWRGAFKNLGLFRLVGRRQATRRDRIKRSENRDMKFWQNKGKISLLQNKEPKIFFDEWLKGHVYKNINWFQKYFEMDRFFCCNHFYRFPLPWKLRLMIGRWRFLSSNKNHI